MSKRFEITAPDGRKFEVTGPDNATEAQALEQIKAQQSTGPDLSWATQPPQAQADAELIGTLNKAIGPGTFDASLGKAARNVPHSAVEFGKALVQPIIHPIDTAEGIYNLGKGILQKTGIVSGTDAEKYANAAGQWLKERYGTAEAIQKTFENDPVGLAADLSMLLTGGGSLAARAPGMVGKVGEATSAIGRTVDPLNAVTGVAKVGGLLGEQVVGGLTGTGPRALRTAFEAGQEGGPAAQAFQQNMRGAVPLENVVKDARGTMASIRKERGDAYRTGMANVGRDTEILDFNRIDNALAEVTGVQTYKGQVLDTKTQGIRQEIGQAVQEWKMLDPKEFHTAEGIDALKRKIGIIRDSTEYGTPARIVADNAYHAIRKTIVDQVPEYAKVMKGYEEASTLIKELEHTLSLKGDHKATVDTTLRKLQSVLRDNVNTNYGQRAKLAEYLVEHGSPQLMEKLAGQALSSWLPRGLQKLAAAETTAAAAGLFGGGATGAGLTMIPTLAAMSPRLMGEAAYYTGKATNTPRELVQGWYQLGRDSALGNDQSPLAARRF